MKGILLLSIVALWLAVVLIINFVVLRRLLRPAWRVPAGVILFAGLVPLPLADEIVGQHQFRTLCEQARQIEVDRQAAQGRAVILKQIPHPVLPLHTTIPRRNMPGTAVPIREDLWEYVDPRSGEVVITYKTYSATGGWLIRILGISEGNAPLIFRHHCEPERLSSLFEDLGIKKLSKQPAAEGTQR